MFNIIKKTVSVFISVLMILSFLTFIDISEFVPVIFAADENMFKYSITDSKAEITGINKGAVITSVIVPEKLGGVPVCGIGKEAFYGIDTLTDITLPETVEYIGEKTFMYCRGLKTVVFPDSLKVIGNSAFEDCDLREIILSSSITQLGDYVFKYCDRLSSVVFPEKLQSIGNGTFDGCTSLENIEIPSSVKKIGDYAFANCNFESFIMPDSVKIIGTGIFKNCSYLKTVKLSESLTEISDEAFDSCDDLEEIHILDSVTRIGESAFGSCWSLTEIPINDNVKEIGDAAYQHCEKIKNISLPDSVTSIGKAAFEGTGFYENGINWESGYLYIGNALVARTGKGGNISVREGTVLLADEVLSNGNAFNFEIPSSVKYIGNRVFYMCMNMNSVTIPASVEVIGDDVFDACTSLRTINVHPDNKYYSSDSEGVLFDKNKTVLIKYPMKKSTSSYKIPNSVKEIDDDAFITSNNLIKIVFPDSLEVIGRNAFFACTSLISLSLPDGLRVIEHGAFNTCNNLTEVVIPSSVEILESYSFSDCKKLKKIVINNPNLEIGSSFVGGGSTVVIHGYSNSSAKEFADENNLSFVSMGTSPIIRVKESENIRRIGSDYILVKPGIKLSELLSLLGSEVVIKDKDGKSVDKDSIMKSGIRIILKYQSSFVADERIIVLRGDNDGDGEVSAGDARNALRASVGLDKMAEWKKVASDVFEINKGNITAADAREILRASVGLESVENWFIADT